MSFEICLSWNRPFLPLAITAALCGANYSTAQRISAVPASDRLCYFARRLNGYTTELMIPYDLQDTKFHRYRSSIFVDADGSGLERTSRRSWQLMLGLAGTRHSDAQSHEVHQRCGGNREIYWNSDSDLSHSQLFR